MTSNYCKVDFIWVNRDHESFEWFIELLAQLESDQLNASQSKLINTHLYITSADTQQNEKIYKNAEYKSINVNQGRPDFDEVK